MSKWAAVCVLQLHSTMQLLRGTEAVPCEERHEQATLALVKCFGCSGGMHLKLQGIRPQDNASKPAALLCRQMCRCSSPRTLGTTQTSMPPRSMPAMWGRCSEAGAMSCSPTGAQPARILVETQAGTSQASSPSQSLACCVCAFQRWLSAPELAAQRCDCLLQAAPARRLPW